MLTKVEEVFTRCKKHGIMLAEGKIQVSRLVRFGGFLIDSSSGEVLITPDPDLLKDIREFPLPQNLTQLRSFKGLVQQVSCWNPDIAALTSGLQCLLKKHVTFTIMKELKEEFYRAR